MNNPVFDGEQYCGSVSLAGVGYTDLARLTTDPDPLGGQSEPLLSRKGCGGWCSGTLRMRAIKAPCRAFVKLHGQACARRRLKRAQQTVPLDWHTLF